MVLWLLSRLQECHGCGTLCVAEEVKNKGGRNSISHNNFDLVCWDRLTFFQCQKPCDAKRVVIMESTPLLISTAQTGKAFQSLRIVADQPLRLSDNTPSSLTMPKTCRPYSGDKQTMWKDSASTTVEAVTCQDASLSGSPT